MNKLSIAIFSTLLFLLLYSSCKEEPIVDPPTPPDPPEDTSSVDTTGIDTSTLIIDTADLFFSDGPSITMNPSGRVPLSADLSFNTKQSSSIEVHILGAEPYIMHYEESSFQHSVDVKGLYADSENDVLLIATNEEGLIDSMIISIQTDPLPDWFPIININTLNRTEMEEGWHLSDYSYNNPGLRTVPFIFDDAAEVRWYMDVSDYEYWSATLQVLENGNFLIGHGYLLVEYDRMGRTVDEWLLDGYSQHHEVYEKPNGNFLVSCNKIGLDSAEDHIIELSRYTGDILNVWDLRQVLDRNRTAYQNNNWDWFHNNAIWYSEADDCLVISGRNQGLAKITADNELVWILAPHLGWGNAGVDSELHNTADFLLTAINSSGTPYEEGIQLGTDLTSLFEWPWGQHAVMVHPENGNILVWDNGFRRNFEWGSNYSRAVEYEVDEQNMTVRQVWQFGRNYGASMESKIISDIDILPQTGNRLVAPGAMTAPVRRSKIVEVTYPDNQIVFEAELLMNESGGNWGEFDIQYRAERIKL